MISFHPFISTFICLSFKHQSIDKTSICRFLRQLPPDSLNALDINLQHIYETAIIETARQIVDRALTLAKKRLHLSSLKWRDRNITTKVHYWGDIPELMVSSVTESNGYLQERVFAQENEYRDSKTFYDSEGMQVLMDEERMEQYDKNVIFENTSADTTWRQDYITFGENWRDDEEETRKVARKLVHKVIHLAHRRWDDIQQKSSIDYLIASTKRLKISISPSVSPPPTDRVPEPILVSPSKQNQAQDPRLQSRDPRLESRDPRLASRDPRLESQDPIFTVDSGINIFLNDDLSSSTSALYPVGSSFSENDFSSETFSRKRRQRSDSHEMTMQRDLAKVRLKLQARKHLSEPAISFQQLSDENSIESEEFPPPNDYNRSLMTHERRSVSEIIFDMRKLSIMEDHEEEDEPEEDEEDEEYTILEAITKPLQMIPDELEPNSKNRLINEPKPFTKCLNSTVPEFNTVETHCGLDPIPINNPHSHSDYTFNDSLFSKPLIHPDSHTIPNLDYYIIIHTHPPPGLCQKFLCNNTNEINLIYHCWLYRELPFDPSITVSQQVEMGVFDPVGVCPVHLDLMDGGIPFYYMEPRYTYSIQGVKAG